MNQKDKVMDNINVISEESTKARYQKSCPQDLLEACEEMRKRPLLKELLGERVFEQYYDSKIAAAEEVLTRRWQAGRLRSLFVACKNLGHHSITE